MADSKSSRRIIWAPQPKQATFIACPLYDVLYGGARGGGKTQAALGDWLEHQNTWGEKASGIYVRRKRVDLHDTIKKSYDMYYPLGATFNAVDKEWRFPSGAWLKFVYLESDNDAMNYQGWNLSRIYVEELTQFPNPEPIDKLHATLRAPGVQVGFRATSNPGGPGHAWVKQRYIDPAPAGMKPIDLGGGLHRIFIPARVEDNKYIDEDYINRLRMSGSPDLVRAWLEGDWNVTFGAAYEKLGNRHMLRPFTPPEYWTKFMVIDWGTYHPYAVGWFCVPDEDFILTARQGYEERLVPANSIIMYRELYGCTGKPNEGTREESHIVARKILEIEESANERVDFRIGDSAMWAQGDGPGPAYRMIKEGVHLGKSKKDRAGNYQELRYRLAGEDGVPLFYATSNCVNFWRTMPSLQLDSVHPEKGVDKQQEDHINDVVMYACASRPVAVSFYERDEEEYREARRKSFGHGKGIYGS